MTETTPELRFWGNVTRETRFAQVRKMKRITLIVLCWYGSLFMVSVAASSLYFFNHQSAIPQWAFDFWK